MAAGTSVLLLDEPLNALDEASARHLRATLAEAARAAAACWVVASHEALGDATLPLTLLDLDARP